jgi:hypothetical protein
MRMGIGKKKRRAIGRAVFIDQLTIRSSELPAVVTTAAVAATTATTAAATTTTTAATAAVAVAAATTAVATTTFAATTAATVAAAATTVAAATVAAAAAAEATTTATAAAGLTLLGLVDAERATIEGAAIHAFDRLGGFFRRAHGHECKAARAARLAIRDEVDVADGSEFLERGANAISGGVEREISNVQTSVHPACSIWPKTKDTTRPEGAMVLEAGFSELIPDCSH